MFLWLYILTGVLFKQFKHKITTMFNRNIIIIIIFTLTSLFTFAQNTNPNPYLLMDSEDINPNPEPYLLMDSEDFAVIGNEVIIMEDYCNARFDFCVQYPSNLEETQGPDNADGRTFIAQDTSVEVMVYGHSALNWGLGSELKFIFQTFDNPNDKRYISAINLQEEDNYFEVWGVVEGQRYYQKTILEDERFVTLILVTDKEDVSRKEAKDLKEELVDSFDAR